MPGHLEFDVRFHPDDNAGRRETDAPMRMLLLGDFSGRGRRDGTEAPEPQWTPVAVDLDNFDTIMAGLRPSLELPATLDDHGPSQLHFNSLDDFHPDTIFDRLAPFAALDDTRNRLKDPARFSQAVADMGRATDTAAVHETDSDTLERLLGASTRPPDRRSSTQADQHGLGDFLTRIVAPYIVPDADPGQALYLDAIHQAMARQMRAILHAPGFQALEALWRSVWWFITSVETGAELQLHLMDVTRRELTADIHAAGDELTASRLYRALTDENDNTVGRPRWSLLMADFTFGGHEGDLDLLAALGAIGAEAGGPFIAQGDMTLLGSENLAQLNDPRHWIPADEASAQRWLRLRRARVARWIGLALPRVLLRLPYGTGGETVERFPLQEITPDSPHDSFLWGSPAVFCGLALAKGFQEQGWDMSPGDCLTLDELPAYVHQVDNEKQLLPCAEQYLSERSGEAVLAGGLMPLMSYRDRNAARLLRFQSIADPPSPLAGPWR